MATTRPSMPTWMTELDVMHRNNLVDLRYNELKAEQYKLSMMHQIDYLKMAAYYEKALGHKGDLFESYFGFIQKLSPRPIQDTAQVKKELSDLVDDLVLVKGGISCVDKIQQCRKQTEELKIKEAKITEAFTKEKEEKDRWIKKADIFETLYNKMKLESETGLTKQHVLQKKVSQLETNVRESNLSVEKSREEVVEMKEKLLKLQKENADLRKNVEYHRKALQVVCCDPAVVPMPIPEQELSQETEALSIDGDDEESIASKDDEESSIEPRKKRARIHIIKFGEDLESDIEEWWTAPLTKD